MLTKKSILLAALTISLSGGLYQSSLAAPTSSLGLKKAIQKFEMRMDKEATSSGRISAFVERYRFKPESLNDVRLYGNLLYVDTGNGLSKMRLNFESGAMEFHSFQSSKILAVTAKETRYVQREEIYYNNKMFLGEQLNPVPVYKDGIPYWQRTKTGELSQWAGARMSPESYNMSYSDGYMRAQLDREGVLEIALVRDKKVVTRARPESNRLADMEERMIAQTISQVRLNPNGKVVWTEIEQVGLDKAQILVVTDRGGAQLEGEIYNMNFTSSNVHINAAVVPGSKVFIKRSVFGLDLPKVLESTKAIGTSLIE